MDIDIIINENKKIIDNALPGLLPAAEGSQCVVTDAMMYSLVNGGKRLRPLLVRLFAKACGKDDEFCNTVAVPFACAVEMIHTYSLIHDDLPCMDDDDTRRGIPSCHKKYGEDMALLAGDALLTLAFETLTDEKNIVAIDSKTVCSIVRIMSERAGAVGMIGGQVADLENEKKVASIDEITTVNLLKTGALIEAACLIGCYLGGADSEQIKAAEIFAGKLGIAFQIQDDILDVIGDESKLGKPVGSDTQNNKSTYVSLLGLDEAKQSMIKLTDEAVAELTAFGRCGESLSDLAYRLVSREF